MRPTHHVGRWAIVAAVCSLVAAVDVHAAEEGDPVADRLAKLPPLIDRQVFFGDPEISGAQLSPDGKWISFRKPYREVMNIWVKGVDEPFEAARAITADSQRPVGGHFWTEDSRYVLYSQDKGGDEDYHVYAVDPGAEAEEATGVPAARDLTPIDGIRALIYAVPEATPTKIIVGINDRDAALHDVYRLDIDSGERQLLIENDTNVAEWITDLEGTVRLAYRQRPDGDYETLVVEDGELGRVLYDCGPDDTCTPARFHKDGERAYFVSNKDVDLARLLLVDVASGEAVVIESDPEGEVDISGTWFSDVTEELAATIYVGDRVRIYPRTDALAAELEWLRGELPDGELGYGSGTEDEALAVVSVSSDVNPGSVYLYSRAEQTLEKLYDFRPELPNDQLANMRPIRYEARDGREIPGYLVVPKGVEAVGLPTVILPHGGPWGRDAWGYNSLAQFLANRGYAVMLPNFRGSAGFGKRFLNEGNGEWGTGVMQHDITDGVQYLVEAGIADPEQVAIMGGSYGGYATLAGVTFTPRLYAAGVSIVGPSNIITLLDSIPPYWGPVKEMFMRRGPQTPGSPVAVLPCREHRGAVADHPGRQRPESEAGRVRPDRRRAAGTGPPGAVPVGAGRGAWVRRPREPAGHVRRHRTVSRPPSGRALPAGHGARGRREAPLASGRHRHRGDAGGGGRSHRSRARRIGTRTGDADLRDDHRDGWTVDGRRHGRLPIRGDPRGRRGLAHRDDCRHPGGSGHRRGPAAQGGPFAAATRHRAGARNDHLELRRRPDQWHGRGAGRRCHGHRP
ncbi:MAG: alpha/beta fold hydrolase [Pseudomonadales bacterium]|nr:alpha/beta fold hydrolase [Pseudomonadales bacterium]